jgi:hypothetical protein
MRIALLLALLVAPACAHPPPKPAWMTCDWAIFRDFYMNAAHPRSSAMAKILCPVDWSSAEAWTASRRTSPAQPTQR